MDNTNNKMLAELIERAEAGEHTKFEYIRTWREYRTRKINRRALKLLVRGLNKSSKSLLKKYCKLVKTGSADVTMLLARNALLKAKEFYTKELEIVTDTIYEYEAYLMEDGNFLGSFVGETRPISELRDYREKVID